MNEQISYSAPSSSTTDIIISATDDAPLDISYLPLDIYTLIIVDAFSFSNAISSNREYYQHEQLSYQMQGGTIRFLALMHPGNEM